MTHCRENSNVVSFTTCSVNLVKGYQAHNTKLSVFPFVVAFRFALCKCLHFICRSLMATSSPRCSLVFQRFVSTVQGLSGDWKKGSSAKVIDKTY